MSTRVLLAWTWRHDPRGRAMLLLAYLGFLGLLVTTVWFLLAADDVPGLVVWDQLLALALAVGALVLITRSVLGRARTATDPPG